MFAWHTGHFASRAEASLSVRDCVEIETGVRGSLNEGEQITRNARPSASTATDPLINHGDVETLYNTESRAISIPPSGRGACRLDLRSSHFCCCAARRSGVSKVFAIKESAQNPPIIMTCANKQAYPH